MGERTHCSSYLLMFGFHTAEDVSLADNGCVFRIVSDCQTEGIWLTFVFLIGTAAKQTQNFGQLSKLSL